MLFERAAENELLKAAVNTAVGGVGQVLLLQGAPGVGKTRLLDSLCGQASGVARVLRGRAGELERDLPLGVVRELFEPVTERATAAERSALFAGAAGLTAPLFGRGTEQLGASLDSAFAVMHGLYWLTANLAERTPLVLSVDDAHWCDGATQRWLAYLIPRIVELPVLLAIGLRPRELDPSSSLAGALAAMVDLTVVEPQALTADGTASLLGDVLGVPDELFCEAVHQATGGNPLLVRTVARALSAARVPPTAVSVDRVEAVGVEGIGRIILPRVHRLGQRAADFARAAAVLGEGCSLHDAGRLAGLDSSAAVAAAGALASADILRADRSLGFTHPLVRAVIADELSYGARAELHRRAADLLLANDAAPDEVARHLLATEPSGNIGTVNVLVRAAQVATGRGAPEAATTFLQRALRERPPEQMRSPILLQLGVAAFRSRHPHTVKWLEQALDAASDPTQWVLTWLTLTQAVAVREDPLPADLYLTKAPRLEGELALPVAATKIMVDYTLPDIPDTIWDGLIPPLEEIPTGATPFQRMWLAMAALKSTMDGESAPRTVRLADLALANGQLLAESLDTSLPGFAAWALSTAGELERSFAVTNAGLEAAARSGSPTPFEWYSTARGGHHLAFGNVAEAEADLLGSFGEHREHTWTAGLPFQLATLIDLLIERGELSQAEEELGRYGLLERHPKPSVFLARFLVSRGRLHLELGRASKALADLEACGTYLRQWGIPHSPAVRWRPDAARCRALLGERERAIALAAEQLADTRRFGAAHLVGAALRALGTVTAGDDGIDLLRESVAVLEGTPVRLEHAHALCDLGVLLRHNRHPRDAREPLARALDFADRAGARALADRANHELRAAGARPRRRAVTGPDALTAAERRVATLAASGRTNTEIAQSLFVTRKTVEKHLGNAFMKLKITARSGLSAALADGD